MKYPNVEQVGSSTEAHEFGHSLGLWPGTKKGHPKENLLGKGQPGIMYPRGTIVDPHTDTILKQATIKVEEL